LVVVAVVDNLTSVVVVAAQAEWLKLQHILLVQEEQFLLQLEQAVQEESVLER
jgi:hypothetical protein